MSKSNVILKGDHYSSLGITYPQFKKEYKEGKRKLWFGYGFYVENKRELCGKTVTVSCKFGARKRLLKGVFCTDGTSYWVEYDTLSATKRAIDDLWFGFRHLACLIQQN